MAKRRKNKKSKSLGGLNGKDKGNIKKVKNNLIDGLALAFGVTASTMAMKFAKGKVPAWIEPFVGILPGTAMAIVGKSDTLKSFGKGFIVTGIIDGANKLTAGKTGVLATVNAAVPKINGLGQYATGNEAAKTLLNGYASMPPRLLMGGKGMGNTMPAYLM